MVAKTRTEIQTRGLKQATVEILDADELAFPDHSFDYVTCGFALQFLNYTSLLPRIRQILKPGGCFAASLTYVPVNDQENFERWKWLFALTRAVFPPNFVPPVAWTAPNRLNRPELIKTALDAAGFTEIETRTEEATFYFADEEDWWAWEWSQASRFWLEGMSPSALELFKTQAFENLKAMQEPAGIPILDGALFAIARAPG
jgi:ubiquinone/menaquinone biosynthesis C-methylase UbiE